MDPILAAILSAGIPLLGNALELVKLFVEAKVTPLTVEEVEERIALIMHRRASQTVAARTAAGYPDGQLPPAD